MATNVAAPIEPRQLSAGVFCGYVYYFLLGLLFPLSLLPLPVLYLLSDIGFMVLFYVVRYRRRVVESNLRHAFPDKSLRELRWISRQFYRRFCDQWIETIKLLSIPRQELNRRVTGNWEVFRTLNDAGKNTYALLGHCFNWEWANVACSWNCPQTFAGVYLPVSNRAFDRLMYRIRSRSGSQLISMKAQKSGFEAIRNQIHIVGLIADQNPSVVAQAQWIPYMHRDAPFFKGPEMMARRAKGAVVLTRVTRQRRGYYKIELELLTEDASGMEPGAVTQAYVRFLETCLRAQPENYLWTHRRWKHQRTQA